MLTRREMLATIPATALGSALASAAGAAPRPLRFGIITDVHHDIMPDAMSRVAAFVEAMDEAKVDFVCQLGDYCWPKEENRGCLAALEKYSGKCFHVLGNHDMDGGASREKAAKFFGLPHRFYSFDQPGVRFIALDGNDPGGKTTGYKRYVAKEQLDWLSKQLSEAPGAVVVLIHQSLDHTQGVENQQAVREILHAAKGEQPKVAAVFSGHHHENYLRSIDNIAHVQINSASYFWMGDKYAHTTSFDAATHARSKYLRYTCPYQDPLWAIVTLDIAAGTMRIEGRATKWLGGSPWEVGATKASHDPQTIAAEVSAREVKLFGQG